MTTADSSATAAGPAESDKAALALLTQRVVAAWAYHDAAAFAEVFTEDGTMILPGMYRKGRDAIRAYMAEAFEDQYKGTQVRGQPLDMRFLGPDVGLMITEGGVLASGESEVSAQHAIRASWLAVRQGDGWRLAAYQNSPRDVRAPAGE